MNDAPDQSLQQIAEFGEAQNKAPQAREVSDEEIDEIARAQDEPGEPWFVVQLTKIEWRQFARDVLEAKGYEMKQKTQWFSYSTPPKRKGLYECTCGEKHHWEGTRWHFDRKNIQRIPEVYKWRGLVKEAK